MLWHLLFAFLTIVWLRKKSVKMLPFLPRYEDGCLIEEGSFLFWPFISVCIICADIYLYFLMFNKINFFLYEFLILVASWLILLYWYLRSFKNELSQRKYEKTEFYTNAVTVSIAALTVSFLASSIFCAITQPIFSKSYIRITQLELNGMKERDDQNTIYALRDYEGNIFPTKNYQFYLNDPYNNSTNGSNDVCIFNTKSWMQDEKIVIDFNQCAFIEKDVTAGYATIYENRFSGLARWLSADFNNSTSYYYILTIPHGAIREIIKPNRWPRVLYMHPADTFRIPYWLQEINSPSTQEGGK